MLAILFVLQSTVDSIPTNGPIWYREYTEYRLCMLSKSAQLEESDAPFDDIFEAAKQRCAGGWTNLYLAAISSVSSGPRVSAGETPEAVGTELIESLEKRIKNETRSIVLSMRVDRKKREHAPNK
jgi:hypothetical protein